MTTSEGNVYPDPAEGPSLQDALLAGLAVSANDLRKVANDLYRSALLSRVEKLVASVIIVASLVTSSISLVVLLQIHGIANTNKTNNTATRDNTATIKDCTDPTGTCYRENAIRTAVLITQLQTSMVVAVECADEFNGRAAINACIAARIAPGPTPSPTP